MNQSYIVRIPINSPINKDIILNYYEGIASSQEIVLKACLILLAKNIPNIMPEKIRNHFKINHDNLSKSDLIIGILTVTRIDYLVDVFCEPLPSFLLQRMEVFKRDYDFDTVVDRKWDDLFSLPLDLIYDWMADETF